MLYLPISFSYLSHYHLLPPKPKTQIICLLISLKCYQLLPPNLKSDHLLPLLALPTAKHRTMLAISPSSESISFLRPPTSNLYNPEMAPHLLWVSSKPTMPTIPTNPAPFSGHPFATNHPHATSTNQKRHPICLGLIQPMAYQLCRSVIHPIQPDETGPKVTTKQI